MSDQPIQSDQGQAQPGQGYDFSQGMQTMKAFGLDPTGDDAIDYARAWLDDDRRNDQEADRDRYTRAAEQVLTAKLQLQTMRNVELFDRKLANDPKTLWEISQLKADTHKPEQPKQDIPSDISGITDPKELFRIAKARRLL